MTNLEYNGNLSDDIKLIKEASEKHQNRLMKLDLCHVCILVVYLIFLFTRLANGLDSIPSLALFINMLIITRSSLSIRNSKVKVKAVGARNRIRSLADKIFNAKSQENNLHGELFTKDFEKAIVIENKEKEKSYDENNKVTSFVDTITNYIYLLDSENTINVLKEVKKTIQEADEKKIEETTLELLSTEDLPEKLPVRQVLKLKKDN